MIPIQRNSAVEETREQSGREKKMKSQQQRPTAKIYAFPPGGRITRQRKRTAAPYFDQEVEALERSPSIVSGSSWYHEAAIDESWER